MVEKLWWKTTHDERQLKDDLSWKTPFDDDHWWKITSDWGQSLIEDNLLMEDNLPWKVSLMGHSIWCVMGDDVWWKMTKEGRWTLMKENLLWKMWYDGRLALMEDDL